MITDAVLDKKVADLVADARARGIDEVFIAASLLKGFTDNLVAYAGRVRTPEEMRRLTEFLAGVYASVPPQVLEGKH